MYFSLCIFICSTAFYSENSNSIKKIWFGCGLGCSFVTLIVGFGSEDLWCLIGVSLEPAEDVLCSACSIRIWIFSQSDFLTWLILVMCLQVFLSMWNQHYCRSWCILLLLLSPFYEDAEEKNSRKQCICLTKKTNLK